MQPSLMSGPNMKEHPEVVKRTYPGRVWTCAPWDYP